MSIRLRSYQREAIDDLFARWKSGATRVPLVLSTGLGKTVIFTVMIEEWLNQPENAGKRVLVIAHTNELIDQAAKKMREVSPSRRIGIVKGPMNNVTAEVIVSSRQTLASEKRRNQIKRVGLIVIDECHHAHSRNTYGKILKHYGAFAQCEHSADPTSLDVEACAPCLAGAQRASDEIETEEWITPPSAKVAGFTATLARSDKMKLSTVWEDCTFKRGMLFGIRNGYLIDVKGEQIIVPGFDLSHVKVTGGDYQDSALADELERTFAPEVIAGQYATLAGDRKGIAFWPLVATAYAGAEAFEAAGITSGVVHGAMPSEERRLVLKRFRQGEIQVLHNAMVLTEGFDDPTIEAVVIARRSKSAGLIQQMAGRGLRPDLTIPPEHRRPCLLMIVASGDELPEYTFSPLIDLSPERLKNAYDEHPDATMAELEEFMHEIEAELDEKREGGSYEFESDEYRGPVVTRAFDPLARDKAWQRTDGGTYFVKSSVASKADSFTFIVESLAGDPGTYDLVQCDARGVWARATEHAGLHLDMALSWGEDLAGDAYNTRKGSWRRRPASEKQKALAARWGIDGQNLTSGEISDAIDLIRATRVIDALVARVRSSVQ